MHNSVLRRFPYNVYVSTLLFPLQCRGDLIFELLEEYGFEVRSSTYLVQAAKKDSLSLVKFLMDHNKVFLKW